MKISSSTAHEISKPLLNTNLVEDDEWYAVSKKWYKHFEYFAYLDNKSINSSINNEEKEEEEEMKENREFPPMMNDSDLRNLNNTCELGKNLNENEHFVWINNKLYKYFIDWFGIEDGSLSFCRKVINIGNEIRNELIIERNPIFICYVLCDDNGNADINTKHIISVSQFDNLNKLMKIILKKNNISLDIINEENQSLDDDDQNIIRVWKKKEINEGGWNPKFSDNEEDVPPSYDQVIEEEEEEEQEEHWVLVNDRDCNISFGEIALNINNTEKELYYMFEIKTDSGAGVWKRKYDINEWRESIHIGYKIDIYDKAYNKWYSGEIIEIDKIKNIIKVHYDGYSSNYDEYLDKYSLRIDKLNTHTAPDPFWSSFNSMGGGISNYNNYNNYSYNCDDTTPPMDNGCVGLRNLGNTCFMNSIIQCLSHCPLFLNYFLNDQNLLLDINKDNPLGWNGKVAETWSKLLIKYWSSKYSVISPNEIKLTISEIQPRFSGYQQHDSSELLQFLLDGLHEDLNRIKKKPYTSKIECNSDNIFDIKNISTESWKLHKLRNDSIIVDLIQGQLQSRVECPDCNKISITFDPYMFLSVPLPQEKKYIIKQCTIIYLDLNILPKKYAVKLNKFSTINELLEILSKKTKISKNQLIITDIWNNHIDNIYNKLYLSIDEISNNENIIVYQIPTNQQINTLLFNNKLNLNNIKFKIIPIYHQFIKHTKYFNSNHTTNKDIGIPLIIKLPIKYNINIKLIKTYINKLIKPYIKNNIEKWIPIEEEEEEEEQPKQIFDDSTEEEEEEEAEAEEQQQEEQQPHTKVPYTFVVLDKYGRNCGECSYSSYCNGCNLNDLSYFFIPDNTYDTRAIGIRWQFGTQKYFNHNVFLSPINDESVSLLCSNNNNNNNNNNYSYTQQYKEINLSDCIDEFVAEETLSKNDAWYCRDCKDHKCATKKLDLYSLPTICIIHLKRFTQNGYYREKNDASVKYPIKNLDLSKWIVSNNNENNNNPTNETNPNLILYDLFAVSIHSGSLSGGHYIAYVKNLNNSKWYEFDDSCVSSINESDVCTSSAYVLFYHRKDIKKEQIEIDTDKDKTD